MTFVRKTGCILPMVALLMGCQDQGQPSGDAESTPETFQSQEDWTVLFDGESFTGWTGLGQERVPDAHWIVEEGTMRIKSREPMDTSRYG